jgi:TetR/AcrR family tetracycline transcriptional repressor
VAERRGRPPAFTRAELIAAARRVGPDAISLPAVAAELQVGRTSLYWHVRDRDEIGEAVLAAILEEEGSHWVPEPGHSWDAALASYARSMRAGLLAAGGWIKYVTPRLVLGQSQIQAMDGLVASLLAGGFTADEATRAYAFLVQVVLASIGTGEAPVTKMHGELAAQLAGTNNSDELTTLRKVVAIAAATSPDAQFEYNLDCALRGISDRCSVPLGAVAAGSRQRRISRRQPS